MTEPSLPEESIFAQALEIASAAERAAFLGRVCGNNAALRTEVEALLRAHDRSGDILDLPEDVQPTTELPASERPGTAFGPYKLLELIGEGGMGTVWMAEQTEPIRRRVAVKVIKEGMDSKQVLARFEAERQALALMEHPNIAKVLDAGRTPSGRPYFVMELVKGQPITKYCDEKRLAVRQRLELFGDVCRAVQHAHQKGIIHRDLKPSNVLVALYDGKPVVKVIDFGVAKASGPRLTDWTLFTGFGALVGTPEYMSPEQAEANNQDIDTRSDIYSLGVLLYELLTGSTPLTGKRIKEAAILEVLRVIREEEPPRPSTRLSESKDSLPSISAERQTEPAKLTKLVRGELDWIVMKALEKDRNRRYETANGFAEDVLRYLADEPVLACPPSAGYRLRKFARRNRGRLAVGGLVLFFLASLGGIAAWEARDRAAQRAALEADIGRDLDEAMAFCRTDRLREASALVDHAQTLAARGADEDLGRRASRLRADVDMAARVEAIRLESAAVKEGNHFDVAGADKHYRDAFRDYGLDLTALEIEAAARRIQASAITDQLRAALDDWLLVQFALGRTSDKRLLAVLRRADADPWRGRFRDAFERGDRRASVELARDPEAAAQPPPTVLLLGKVLLSVGERPLAGEVLRSAQHRHPDDFWINQNLAVYLMESKPIRVSEAIGYYRAALAQRPDSPGVHFNLGHALRAQGDLARAAAEYRKATDLKPDYAAAHDSLGAALDELGDFAGAVAEYRKALALEPHDAVHHHNLGVALGHQGDLPDAATEYRKAVNLQPDYAGAHDGLGEVLNELGDRAGALAECRKAIELQPDLAEAHGDMGMVLRDQGDWAGAAAEFRKAIALKPELAQAHHGLGNVLGAQGDLAGAAAAYRKAIELKPEYAEAHSNLGIILYDQGDPAAAAEEYRKAVALKPNLATVHSNLGVALYAQGDLAAAAAEHRKAIELEPNRAEPHANLGSALYDQGDRTGAAAEFRKAIELKPVFAEAHCSLGIVLRDQGDLAGAAAELRKAIELKPDYAEAHRNLGIALLFDGEFQTALAEFRRGDELEYPRGKSAPNDWVRRCQRLIDLDGRLPGFLDGKIMPASAEERIELAELCSYKRLNSTAVRFYEAAFASPPESAARHLTDFRYEAACAAAVAGCGQGKDADKLGDKNKARLRDQALGWMRAELEAVARPSDTGAEPASSAARARKLLNLWLVDPHLAGVRGPEALAKLPEAEREPWRKFWADAAVVLARLGPSATEPARSRVVMRFTDSDAWVTKGNELHQVDESHNGHVVLFGDPGWSDYEFEAEIQVGAGDFNEAGLVFRATGRDHRLNACIGSFGNTRHALLGSRSGAWAFAQIPGKVEKGPWYRLRVEARGDEFKMFLEGTLILSGHQDEFPHGCVGFVTVGASARFRNPKVTDLSGKVLLEGAPDVPPKAKEADREPGAAFRDAVKRLPDDAKAHFALGSFHAQLGEWQKAGAEYDRGLELEPTNHAGWLLAAALHAATGDAESYRRTCAKMLERLGSVDNPQTAEQTAKACLLLPSALSPADVARAQKLAEQAVTGTKKDDHYRFFAMAKGLADYRAGQYADSVTWEERAVPHANGIHWDAFKYAALAMAHHQLGHTKEAEAALENAKAILMKMPDPAKGQTFGADDWHAWLHARILCREADEQLTGPKAPGSPESNTGGRGK